MKDPHAGGSLALAIRPGRQIWYLYGAAVALCAACVLGWIVRYGMGLDNAVTSIFTRLTDVGYEQNIPAWFQSIVLFINALALWNMSTRVRTRREQWQWRGLAVAFAYLSLDEFASLHEQAGPLVRGALQYSWLPTYTWTVLAIPLVAVFGLLYVPFLKALPASTRWGFLIAAALYLGGALGMELIGSLIADTAGEASWAYRMEAVAEEFLEMVGAITLLGVVAQHATRARPA